MAEIKLLALTKGEVRNLSGHERGSEARRMFDLERLDRTHEPVKVLVPANLDAISTSFFQGLFAESVRQLGGRENFLSHYRFDARPDLLRQIQRGIDAVQTKRHSALAH